MQCRHGVHGGIEGLVARSVAAGLPEADRPAALESGDDTFGGELAKELGVALGREVQVAGPGLGESQAGEQRILGGIDADHEQQHLTLGAGRPARPALDAETATPLDAPDAAMESGMAVFLCSFGVLIAGVDGHVRFATEEAEMTKTPIVGPNALNPSFLSPEERWEVFGRIPAQAIVRARQKKPQGPRPPMDMDADVRNSLTKIGKRTPVTLLP